MRAGRLSTRLMLLNGSTELGGLWADVRPPLDVGPQKGLREAGQTKIIIRPRKDIRPGLLLRGGGNLYVIDGEGDRLVLKQDQHLSCTRLRGDAATYTAAGVPVINTVAAVFLNTPYIGINGQMMDYRYRIEIPSAHQPERFTRGDSITVAGVTYQLLDIDHEGDDGAVIRYMA